MLVTSSPRLGLAEEVTRPKSAATWPPEPLMAWHWEHPLASNRKAPCAGLPERNEGERPGTCCRCQASTRLSRERAATAAASHNVGRRCMGKTSPQRECEQENCSFGATG